MFAFAWDNENKKTEAKTPEQIQAELAEAKAFWAKQDQLKHEAKKGDTSSGNT